GPTAPASPSRPWRRRRRAGRRRTPMGGRHRTRGPGHRGVARVTSDGLPLEGRAPPRHRSLPPQTGDGPSGLCVSGATVRLGQDRLRGVLASGARRGSAWHPLPPTLWWASILVSAPLGCRWTTPQRSTAGTERPTTLI